MEELHRAADKLFEELDHLDRLLDADLEDEATLVLSLSVAKRVRRHSNVVVRELAILRDDLQPEEGTRT